MRMTPTATNDSQKPAASGANTSSNNTAISASDQVRARADVPRREPGQREHREHQPGALRRHRKPREQCVGARGARPNNNANGSRSTRRAERQPAPREARADETPPARTA